jgi:NAD dependent epimerase/dehydratase family enzyme
MVGRHVKALTPAPANLRDLTAAVIRKWEEIDQAVIQHFYEVMPRRMEAVIQARGGKCNLLRIKLQDNLFVS